MTGFYFIGSIIIALIVLLGKRRSVSISLTGLFIILQLGFTVYTWLHIGETEWLYFTFDAAGVLFLSVLALLSAGTFWHSIAYLSADDDRRTRLYYSGLIGLIVSISGAYLANNLMAIWIFVEATTLTVASLIYHDRTPTALEATWKYIFVCSVGIAIAYFGILFLSASLENGHSFSMDLATLKSQAALANPVFLKLAFICVLVGYSTKMGLFPMHTVAVDAHTVAPPPVSALISTALMNVGFLAIYRTYEALSVTPIYPWMNHLLILAGTLSLLVSSAYMQKVKHLKRMFAYSSLENMGLVAIGLGIGGWGVYAAFLHIVLHSFVKASLFFQIGEVHRIYHSYDIEKTGSYLSIHPAGAVLILIATLGITAIPPSGMFISEFFIFRELILSGSWIVFIPAILFLTFILYAFLKRILHLIYAPMETLPVLSGKPGLPSIPAIILMAMVIFLCFIRPPFLDEILHQIIMVLPK